MPPVVRNPKSAVGAVWPKLALISSIEEYGASAFLSLLKFNYTVYIQPILLYGSETWAFTQALEDRIAAFDASDIFCGFPTWTTLPMLIYVSEPALHRSCCRSSKQDGSISLGMWHGWVTRVTCPGPYIRQFAGYPRIGGAAQDVRITPGFGPWKQTFSRSIMAWTQHGVSSTTEDVGSSSWKRLCSSQGHAHAPRWWWWDHLHFILILLAFVLISLCVSCRFSLCNLYVVLFCFSVTQNRWPWVAILH